MVNHSQPLCQATNMTLQKAISRAQLALLLAKVNGALFAKFKIMFCYIIIYVL